MAELQLISSDSHVSEPPDLWVERIDTKYRDRAPKVVLNPEGQEGAYLVYEGYPPHNLAIGLGAGSEQRASIAVTIIGGQTLCLLLTLLVVPVAYSYFTELKAMSWAEWKTRFFGRSNQIVSTSQND